MEGRKNSIFKCKKGGRQRGVLTAEGPSRGCLTLPLSSAASHSPARHTIQSVIKPDVREREDSQTEREREYFGEGEGGEAKEIS